MTFNDFVRNALAEEALCLSGTHYTSDLAFELLDAYNSAGSYTCNRHLSKELIKEFWQDAADYVEENPFCSETNPFGDPDGFLVCMMLWKGHHIVSGLPIVQQHDKLDFDNEEVVEAFLIELKGEHITNQE